MQSEGLASRLVGAPSTTCSGQTLVVAGNTNVGFLLQKLRPSPRCGAQMPLVGTPLTQTEIDCVRAWIGSLASGLPDGSASDGDSTDAAAQMDVAVILP